MENRRWCYQVRRRSCCLSLLSSHSPALSHRLYIALSVALLIALCRFYRRFKDDLTTTENDLNATKRRWRSDGVATHGEATGIGFFSSTLNSCVCV